MRDYHDSKFSLIWVKEGKVTEGSGGGQVENVLNCPGEIGLTDLKWQNIHLILMFVMNHLSQTFYKTVQSGQSNEKNKIKYRFLN